MPESKQQAQEAGAELARSMGRHDLAGAQHALEKLTKILYRE